MDNKNLINKAIDHIESTKAVKMKDIVGVAVYKNNSVEAPEFLEIEDAIILETIFHLDKSEVDSLFVTGEAENDEHKFVILTAENRAQHLQAA